MDKICRGSRIGEAHHSQGTFAGLASPKSVKPQSASPQVRSGQLQRRQQSPDANRPQDFCRATPQSKGCLSPRFRTGGNMPSPASSRSWLQQSRSARNLGKIDFDMTPRSPRSQQESAQERSEALAESWRGRRDLFDGTPRQPTLRSPRSPRALHSEDAEDRGRRRSDGACSPSPAEQRSPSPTYHVSEDWMGYSSPRGDREGHRESAAVAVEGTMPSSNFSSRLRRQHSGRITENSDNWLRAGGESARPGPPVISNSENFNPSKGKKTAFAKEPSDVKRRLHMDTSQPEPLRSQRRHDFAETPLPCQLSPRSQPQPTASDTSSGSKGGQAQVAFGVQQRTSAAMAASLMPEASASSEAVPSQQPKYMIGNEIVDWQTSGRRIPPVCSKQVTPGSLSQKAMSMACLRDHRNSDIVREQLQFSPAEASPEQPSLPKSVSRVQSSVQLTPARAVEGCIYSFGEFSSLPSTMQKDTAYLHSGLKVVKYGTRSPGAFSPNVVRVPAAQVLQC
mmetsp:Transcript_115482/g.337786  ORF Transcript_115482/g.337786 Transcript_115482/m.337786 type:complete len:508 (-) Transcript_115482:113-1636(-)